MKNIIKLFTFPLLTIIGFNSCASIPLKIGESENNSTYTVSYLFEHDGCKVYRFYDKGNYVYFTTRGDVTSITNDSTAQRTITINKTPYDEGGNLAASKIRNLECPSYEICLIDYGCGKFNRKIHIMEQYP